MEPDPIPDGEASVRPAAHEAPHDLRSAGLPMQDFQSVCSRLTRLVASNSMAARDPLQISPEQDELRPETPVDNTKLQTVKAPRGKKLE
jgi:hypothetical protein